VNETDLLHQLENRACSGDVTAQYYLSIVYEEARYGQQDLVASAIWCEQAARAGDRQSQYRLSKMLESGRGFDKIHLRASWYWLEQAAQAGHIEACFSLGVRYLFGAYGVRKSIRKARLWLLASARACHAEANYYLGYMYLNAYGVNEQPGEAFHFFSRAVELGSVKAQCSLAAMLEHGIACEIDHERSQKLYELAADNGHTGAQMYLATRAFSLANYSQALYRFEQAANAGVTEAQAFLVWLLSRGPLALQNKARALFWCFVLQHTDTNVNCMFPRSSTQSLGILLSSANATELMNAEQQALAWIQEHDFVQTQVHTQESGGNQF